MASTTNPFPISSRLAFPETDLLQEEFDWGTITLTFSLASVSAGGHMTHPELPQDQLDLPAADRAIRINELEAQLEELGLEIKAPQADCPPGIYERFLESAVEYERTPLTTPFERLVDAGVELPEAEAMSDADLHAKLWEVIHALAEQRTYLLHTDHLSDRELYAHLWSESLREMGGVLAMGEGWTHFIDILGSGSEEDSQICLRYYDTPEERARWAKEWPNDVIPPQRRLAARSGSPASQGARVAHVRWRRIRGLRRIAALSPIQCRGSPAVTVWLHSCDESRAARSVAHRICRNRRNEP